jgi:hypothetical protein
MGHQSMIAGIQHFLTVLLPTIESEPGDLHHLDVSFRDPRLDECAADEATDRKCRDCEQRRESVFLVDWKYQGRFLEAATKHDVMLPPEQKAFENHCKRERRAYL